VAILYHYTNETGLSGILQSGVIWASRAATRPRDVRYGEGQYLTDIEPGTRSRAKLSFALVGHPFAGKRFTHYVAIEVSGLNVVEGRDHVFVIRNAEPLEIRGRLIASGES
jgi:hypothetical protein